MAGYQDLAEKQEGLIRKMTDGSVFVAASSVAAITTIAGTGSALIAALPTGYFDLGLLTDDGAAIAAATQSQDVTSWGQFGPTRTDIINRTPSLTCTAQETKALTVGLMLGVDAAAATIPTGGQYKVDLPTRPKGKSYRVLVLGVDENEDGEIYIARFMPNAKLTNIGEQSMNGGVFTYPFTFTGSVDSALGTAETWFFHGPGWLAMLADMGFTPPS